MWMWTSSRQLTPPTRPWCCSPRPPLTVSRKAPDMMWSLSHHQATTGHPAEVCSVLWGDRPAAAELLDPEGTGRTIKCEQMDQNLHNKTESLLMAVQRVPHETSTWHEAVFLDLWDSYGASYSLWFTQLCTLNYTTRLQESHTNEHGDPELNPELFQWEQTNLWLRCVLHPQEAEFRCWKPRRRWPTGQGDSKHTTS